MPVYEYLCSKGHSYEKTEGFDAKSRQKCIKCGAMAQRQISMPAVIFKGSGFYNTDNRKSGWTPSDSSSDSTSSSSDATASTNGHGHSHSEKVSTNKD